MRYFHFFINGSIRIQAFIQIYSLEQCPFKNKSSFYG